MSKCKRIIFESELRGSQHSLLGSVIIANQCNTITGQNFIPCVNLGALLTFSHNLTQLQIVQANANHKE